MRLTAHHLYLLAPGATAELIQRFYGDGLGLPALNKPDTLAHVPVLWFDGGAIVFHVGYPSDGSVGQGHTALTTPDLEAARRCFESLGYPIDDNVIPMGYPRFYVQDPWGNQFEILPAFLENSAK